MSDLPPSPFLEKVVVHVLVQNPDGRILLQRLAPHKRNPGKWGSSAAGWVNEGENAREAALRKLQRELGMNPKESDLHLMKRGLYMDDTLPETGAFRKQIFVWLYKSDEAPRLYREHVSALLFIRPNTLAKRISWNGRAFTPTFRVIWKAVGERFTSNSHV